MTFSHTVRGVLAASATVLRGCSATHDRPGPQQGLVEDPALWEPVLGVQRDFLDAAFDQARQSFGSMDEFLRDGLGMDDATLDALRIKLAG